jgi:hypothetical protein
MKKSMFFLIIFLCASALVFADELNVTLPLANETTTALNVVPPDGKNGWYKNIPMITLSNPLVDGINDAQILYHWDIVLPDQVYAGPIVGIEDPAIGGISTLHYHAEDSYGNTEPDRVFTSKVDFTPPSILDVHPSPDAIIYNSSVDVSAYLEEFFFSNSGINKALIVLKLDDDDIPFDAVAKDKDVVLKANLENITSGWHKLFLACEDNAGNKAELEWHFMFSRNAVFSLDVESPLDGSAYGNRRVPLVVSTEDPVSIMEYSDNGKPFYKMCSDCSRGEMNLSLSEGSHTLVVRAKAGVNEYSKTLKLLVDTRVPRISKTSPVGYTTGNFSVSYSEDNVDRVTLFWKNVKAEGYNRVDIDGCPSGSLKSCSTLVDFSSQESDVDVEYYFVVYDRLRSAVSRKQVVKVDTSKPFINVTFPEDKTYDSKSIPMLINTSELVRMISYSPDGKAFRSLCTKCDSYARPKPFSDGRHNITFRAYDYAGNFDEVFVGFEVDSMAPLVRKVFPYEITNGTFWVVYTEDDLQSATFYYDGHSKEMDCRSGKNMVCSVSVDLKDYDGSIIEYYFKLTDKVHYTVSPLKSVRVDLAASVEFKNDNSGGITPIF